MTTESTTTAQELIPAPAEPRREYTAGSASWLSYLGAVRALPHAVDDLEQELGDDLYTRMLRDPRVAGDVGLLIAAVLEDGYSLTPAATPEGDAAAAAAAAESAAFVRRCLDHLDIPLPDVLADMLDALSYGCRIAEQVYADGAEPDAGRLVLRAIKVKPRRAVAFVVDPYLNVLGMLAAEPGRPLAISTVVTVGAPPPPSLLPRSKFAVLSYRPKDSDPRGRTILRAAYNWWWIKTQLLPELMKFGAQFGTPSLLGTTAEAAAPDPSDPTKSPEQLLLEKLLAFQSGTALSVPFDTKVEVLQAALSGGESFFERCIDLCDRQISTAIIGATRATQEAKSGSKADSETAKGLFDSIVSAARSAVATMLQRDVVAPLLRYNDARWAAYPPIVALGGVESEDRTPAWNAAANLERAGYLDSSQYPALDAQLGIPQRTPEEVEARRDRRAAPAPQPAAPMPPMDGGTP
jgi:hypothetical protein